MHVHAHVDLLDLYRGGLSLRKLSVLIRHLPRNATSALWREMVGGPFHTVEDLMAASVDALRQANWIATFNPKLPVPHPEPLPRPGDDRAKASKLAQLLQFRDEVAAQRRRREGA